MDKKYVISQKNLPTKSPIISTIAMFTALDYWEVNSMVIGAMAMLYFFIWLGFIKSKIEEEQIDLKVGDLKRLHLSFKDRLQKLMNRKIYKNY